MNNEIAAAETNPYLPPQAPVADAEIGTEESLYVVAPWKFLTLMIGTAGVYGVYWFYKNWSLLNRKHQAYWPVPRAIFAIFFTHSLFDEIDGRIRRSGNNYAWSPKALATVYVICALISGVSGRLSSGVADARSVQVFNLLLMVPMVFALYRGQLAVNVAESDPKGTRNNSLTGANIAWLVVGALWWGLILFGLFLILTGRAAR